MTWQRRLVLMGFALSLTLVLSALGLGYGARAAEGRFTATAQWQMHGSQPELVVLLAEALTPKQKSIISGGFTTVSLLTIRDAETAGDEDDTAHSPLLTVRCSVKFDAWEETYDVARFDVQPPRTATFKGFNDYGTLCLKADLKTPAVLAGLAAHGGSLRAILIIKQTSAQEAQRIKDWLVQQQSGVMQSLFSHMLGELSLNQTLLVTIAVPPQPSSLPAPPPRHGALPDLRLPLGMNLGDRE